MTSPDGRQLAFSAAGPRYYEHDIDLQTGRDDFNSNNDILLVSTTDGEVTRLTQTFSPEYQVFWSPDGSRLAYQGRERSHRSKESDRPLGGRFPVGPAFRPGVFHHPERRPRRAPFRAGRRRRRARDRDRPRPGRGFLGRERRHDLLRVRRFHDSGRDLPNPGGRQPQGEADRPPRGLSSTRLGSSDAEKLGVDTQIALYPNEGHGVHREPRHTADYHERAIAWFDKYLK